MKRALAVCALILVLPLSKSRGASQMETYTPSDWATLKVPSDDLTRVQMKAFGIIAYDTPRVRTLEAVAPQMIAVGSADLRAKNFKFPIILAYKVNSLEA